MTWWLAVFEPIPERMGVVLSPPRGSGVAACSAVTSAQAYLEPPFTWVRQDMGEDSLAPLRVDSRQELGHVVAEPSAH
ncbi:MAG: hypothetical protein QW828_04870 [Candidatus Bathyarchaeia archaeon]